MQIIAINQSATLAQLYRQVHDDGSISGGPMYYLDMGLKELGFGKIGKVLGVLYAIFIIGGAFALTAMLLPGISGALVLLTLGQYTIIASSFHDGDLEPFFFLVIGGIIGLFTFVPLMNYMISLTILGNSKI